MKPLKLSIQGLDCPDCAVVIEPELKKLPGVKDVKLDFTRGQVIVTGEAKQSDIVKRLSRLGFTPLAEQTYRNNNRLDLEGFLSYFLRMKELKLVILGSLLLMVSFFFNNWNISTGWVKAIQLMVLPLAGWPVFRNAYQSLIKEHTLNINVLMSIAAIGAVVINETHEAIIMLILFVISEAIEGYTNDHARSVLSDFTDLAPKFAKLVIKNIEQEVPIESLNIGDIILVKAGERFPMDGIIKVGSSEVNQAPITGESKLVFKSIGDEVLSGTVNGQGVLKVKITRLASDTTIQRIIDLVTDAQANKTKNELFIDKFAKVYTPIVVLVATLVVIVPTVFFKQPLWNIGENYGWLHRSLSLLMIGCPCALVISTPIANISALTRAAQKGVIFKGSVFLEGIGKSRVVAFDKTGTLTKGRPEIKTVKALDCEGAEPCEPCNDLLALACSLEYHSNHPLSRAVIKEGTGRGVVNRYTPPEDLTTLSGRGQQGSVNGKLATIGSLSLFEIEHNTPANLVKIVKEAEYNGQSTMLVCDGEGVRGFLSVEDEIRTDAVNVISSLNDLGLHSVILTGDNQQVAEMLSNKLGIKQFYANLLPQEKLAWLSSLREQYGQVIMVGDGINDAPALAFADVGVAMGGAENAQVMETADVILMNDSLDRLPFTIKLSRLTNKLIKQNIFFSLGTKFIVAILAMLGITPLWVAVLADIGISLSVTLNGMRTLNYRGI